MDTRAAQRHHAVPLLDIRHPEQETFAPCAEHVQFRRHAMAFCLPPAAHP